MPRNNTKISISAENKTEVAFSKINQSLGKLEKATRKNSKAMMNLEKATGKVKSGFGGLKTAVTGVVGAMAVKEFINFGSNFERSITKINAVAKASGATKTEMEGLRGTIDQIGSTTAFTQKEVADVAFGLLTLGDSATQASNKLGVIVKLAGATESSMDLVSGSVTAMSKIFGENASFVANQFTGAYLSSSANVEKLSSGLSVAGSTASAMGVNMQDTVAVLSLLNDKTIQGAEAGTAFRNILALVTAQGAPAQEALAKIGLETDSFRDSAGNLKSVDDIFKTLSSSLGSLEGNAEKAAVIQKVFGRETLSAVNAVLGAFKDNDKVLDNYRKNIEKTGNTTALYNQMTNDLKGKMDGLGSVIQSKLILAFETLSPVLNNFVEKATKFVSGFDNQTIANTILDVAESVVIFASGSVQFLENLFEAGKKTAQFFGLIGEGEGSSEIEKDSVAGKALSIISEQRQKLNEITQEQVKSNTVIEKNLKTTKAIAKAEEKRAKSVQTTNEAISIQAKDIKELSPNFDELLQKQIAGFGDMEKVAIVKFLEQNDAVQKHFEDLEQIEEGNLEKIEDRFGEAFELMVEETEHGLDRVKKRHEEALTQIDSTTKAFSETNAEIWKESFEIIKGITQRESLKNENEWQIGLANIETKTRTSMQNLKNIVDQGWMSPQLGIVERFRTGLEILKEKAENSFKDLDLVIKPIVDFSEIDKIQGAFDAIFPVVKNNIFQNGGTIHQFEWMFSEIKDGIEDSNQKFNDLFADINFKINELINQLSYASYDASSGNEERTTSRNSGLPTSILPTQRDPNIHVNVYADLDGQVKLPVENLKASINEQARRNNLAIAI